MMATIFLLGCFVGVLLVLALSACVVAGRADRANPFVD